MPIWSIKIQSSMIRPFEMRAKMIPCTSTGLPALIPDNSTWFTTENLLLDYANLAVAKDQPSLAACCLDGLSAPGGHPEKV